MRFESKFEHNRICSQNYLDIWLSWLERFVYIEEVGGSNPSMSTQRDFDIITLQFEKF